MRGNRSLSLRPASTQKRAAGFGRQFKNCAPSAAPKGDGAPIAPRPRRSGPRVSGGNSRIARPQPPLKRGGALQSPRVHAEAGCGFRAAIQELLPLSRPKGAALQSPRAPPLKRKRGFRAAIKELRALSRPKEGGAHQSGSPFATSIGAAVRCRFRRLFRLTRGAPCGLKAAPATGRPVVSLPSPRKPIG